MPSPAQLLAMKHAESDVEANADVHVLIAASIPVDSTSAATPPASSTNSSSSMSSAISSSTVTEEEPEDLKEQNHSKRISMDDEEAFPSLGSSVGASAPLSWGPSSNGSKSSAAAGNSLYAKTTASAFPSFRQAVRSSNTQLTFIVNVDQQLDLSKAEIFRIFSRIKQVYGVSIESTLSTATSKRTFLLSGPASNIQDAKRDVLKRLTKPVKIQFSVPSSLRAAIIGSQGKNLKPILEATKTKIDIERNNPESSSSFNAVDSGAADNTKEEEEDEIFGRMLTATIEGDIAGCNEAKARIMAIVNEHTKTLNIRLNMDPELKPFLRGALNEVSFADDLDITYPDTETESSSLILTGSREAVLDAREKIKSVLALLQTNLISEEQIVPKYVHSLLDPQKVFESTNVIVRVPDEDSDVQTVTFIGARSNIPTAVAFAKQYCASFFVDSLDLARSHGGNSLHAKCLTAYFLYTKFFEELSSKYDVKIHAPSYASLANDDIKTAILTFASSKEKKDVLKQVRKEVVDAVNKMTPNLVRVESDINSFVFGKINNSFVTDNGVSIVPLGNLAGFGNKLILILQQGDNEFLPSDQEIQQKLDSVDLSLEPLRSISKTVVSKVIPVGNEDQAHLVGKTLGVLLGKFESGNIEIKLHQNATGPSSDEIFLRGFDKDIENAISDISQAIEDVKNYEEACKYNTSVDFPSNLLSRLIGHNGKHLDQLREDFDVKIDVLDEGSRSEEQNTTTPVQVTGLKSNADECIKHLSRLTKKWSDEKTVVMKIDPKFHRRLIGPGGVYVNRLQDRYNVNVRFPHEKDKDHKDEVVIRGPTKGVTKAAEEMKELLQYEQENGYTEKIKVPAEVLSRVIGRNGEHIKDISADAGVTINNMKTTHEQEKKQGFAEFEIIGSRSAIKKAKESIGAIVDKVENYTTEIINVDRKWHRFLIGPRGSIKRQIILEAGGSDDNRSEFRKFLQVPDKDSDSDQVICSGDRLTVDKIVKEIKRIVSEQESVVTKVVVIPKKKHRLLIGPGGSVRRSLEEEYKVNVTIPRVSVDSDEVQIRGSSDQIAKVISQIDHLVE
ncbi:hypothetical protein FOA43_003573 [Brettanomyces nanus]|uniref:K Homology domain-containing protein n=1 Tax=Eeniella nana TaxID=13502 RepID=A0A875RWA2_EENNA|nr:uncharacterized protein FOA43_003573 [Brettanomyces nanus]QPG76187.1 hypothetical protein FOA43_003573 [Brettanomyces nanus]